MDLIQRYIIPGYIFSALVALFSEPTSTFLGDIATRYKYWAIIIGAIAGLPIGYVLGQVSTFIFHFVPGLSIFQKVYSPTWSPLFVGRSVATEAQLYCDLMDKTGQEFRVREWLNHRWSYLIISFNLIAAIIVAPVVAMVINRSVTLSIFSFPSLLADKLPYVITSFAIIVLILFINLSNLYFFLITVYRHSIGIRSTLYPRLKDGIPVAFFPPNKNDFSAIITTHDRPRELERALRSIKAQSLLPADIYVLDSSSEPSLSQNTRMISTVGGKGPVFHVLAPNGLAAKRNLASKLTRCEVLFFFDDDVILQREYFSRIMKIYRSHPTAIGAMGRVRNQRQFGRTERWYRLLFRLFRLSEAGESRVQRSGYLVCPVNPATASRVAKPQEYEMVAALWGCNMSFRRKLFEYESFDESWDVLTDIEFSLVAARYGALFLDREATLLHKRTPVGRMTPRHLLFRQALAARRILAQRREPSLLNGLVHYWSLVGVLGLAFISIFVDPTSSSYTEEEVS